MPCAICQQAVLDQYSDGSPPYIVFTTIAIKIDRYLFWMGCKLNKHYFPPITVYSCGVVLNSLKFTPAKINTAVRNNGPAMSVTIKWHPNVAL